MKVKKYLEVALGIVTSIGGFLEAGSIATSAQAGAGFGFQHDKATYWFLAVSIRASRAASPSSRPGSTTAWRGGSAR